MKTRPVATWLLSALAVLCLAPAAFVAAQGGHGGAEGGGHAPQSMGEEIFNPQAIDLAIWTMVVFLLLLLFLTRFAWKPMLEGLRKREESIRGAMEEARRLQQENEQLAARHRAEMEAKSREIADMMAEARRDAEKLRESIRAEAHKETEAERERLRREIETAKDQALHELWNQTAQLATLVSAKAIRRSLTEDDQRRLQEEALAAIEEGRRRRQAEMREFGADYARGGDAGSGGQ